MVVLDGNFALDCGSGVDYPLIHIFQCVLERKNAITNEVLGTITFVLAYSTALVSIVGIVDSMRISHKTFLLNESQAFLKSVHS